LTVDSEGTLQQNQNKHFSQGSKFTLKSKNGDNYLQNNDNYAIWNNGKIEFVEGEDNIQNFINIELEDKQLLHFRLVWKDMYFNDELKPIVKSKDDAFRFMWAPMQIVPNEGFYDRLTKTLTSSTTNDDRYKDYISVEGVNLLNSSELQYFNITFNDEFTKHLCYFDSDPQITFHIGDYQVMWQVQLKIVENGEIALYLPNAGYLSSALDSVTEEVLPVFVEELNPDLVILEPTNNPTEFKLYSKPDKAWVNFINNPNYALGDFTPNEDEAAIIRFYAVDRDQYYTKHGRTFHEYQIKVNTIVREREEKEEERLKQVQLNKLGGK
ncbi:hypothetical protein CONCODRAFT_79459, partial [Conidiobolus coronatus NRRL 28638]